MKKIWRILFPIVISTLLVNLQFGNSAINVSVGDKIDYSISKAYLEVGIGSNYLEVSGINFNGNNIEEGSFLTTEINGISSIGATFTYEAEGYSVEGIIRADTLEIVIPFSVMCVFNIMGFFGNDWTVAETMFAEGYNILYCPTFVPFIDITESTWDYIEGYSYDFAYFFITATSDHVNYTIDYTSKIKSDVLTAEWVVEMTDLRSNEVFTSNITGISQYQISIQKSTGIVLGSRYEGSCFGDVNGTAVDVSASLLFEEIDYNMPAFKLNPSQGASAIGFIFSIICIFVISKALNFSKKRKR